MMSFRAFLVSKQEDGTFRRELAQLDQADLPRHPVLIDVRYSSLNYKDGLSISGNPGVTRKFPHVPGVDAAGVVAESQAPEIKVGDEVLVQGFDLGMNTWGGFGERMRVPSEWIIPLPSGLTLEESMILGTAGFTAALCVDKLEAAGMRPGSGPVAVSGATGGVGCTSVMLLAKLGYEVVAISGKTERHDWLKGLGADRVMTREQASEGHERVLSRPTWGGVVDTVGGDMLWNLLKSLNYGCSLAACGLVGGASIPATVFPFLLRHVNLLGVDSVELPMLEKRRIWGKLAGEWKIEGLQRIQRQLALEDLSQAVDKILAGDMFGRGVIHHRPAEPGVAADKPKNFCDLKT